MAAWTAAGVAGLLLAWFLAIVAGAAIPANAGWRQPASGVTIFVRTNGLHTEFVVPASAAGVDWRRLIRADHIERPDLAGDHIAFGWGDRDFYLETPTWDYFSIGTGIGALFGSGASLMHVDHVQAPQPSASQRPIVLTPAQYSQLSTFILRSFRLPADGELEPIRGYGASDVFYPAHGSYNLLKTSNEWTGAGLRSAGVRVGIWTPIAESVMWRLKLRSRDGRRPRNSPSDS